MEGSCVIHGLFVLLIARKEVDILETRGRPKKENSKSYRYGLRLTEDEIRMLEEVCESTGESKSDIIRRGLTMIYNLNKYKLSED